jgi:hypothetical protein
MTQVSEVLRLSVDRSSVAMADDVNSHHRFWGMHPTSTIDDLLIAISEQLLPSVIGPAGWRVYRDFDDPARRLVVGLIYTRDDLQIADLICRCTEGGQQLRELARPDGSLHVYAHYMTRDQARPVTMPEVQAGPGCTGAKPVPSLD